VRRRFKLAMVILFVSGLVAAGRSAPLREPANRQSPPPTRDRLSRHSTTRSSRAPSKHEDDRAPVEAMFTVIRDRRTERRVCGQGGRDGRLPRIRSWTPCSDGRSDRQQLRRVIARPDGPGPAYLGSIGTEIPARSGPRSHDGGTPSLITSGPNSTTATRRKRGHREKHQERPTGEEGLREATTERRGRKTGGIPRRAGAAME
jgi:predicted small lipoprotein YifL